MFFDRYITENKIQKDHIIAKALVLEKIEGKKKSLRVEYENKIYTIQVTKKIFRSSEVNGFVELYYNKEVDSFDLPNKKPLPDLLAAIFCGFCVVYLLYQIAASFFKQVEI